ncbi:mucin-7-like [Amphibalanus amphitrite]|uniref:mucin-7-like n=1 Tax=Amphibalanus amphitrite TaxID=1232801 RepID=UPI001C90E75B|nr:mucin-7-like [Amphibalanus amphitrite]
MDSQKFCLKWDGFQGSVTSVFDQLRSGGELLDVTLFCEGQRVRAHRMMLSACSPYFRELLKELTELPPRPAPSAPSSPPADPTNENDTDALRHCWQRKLKESVVARLPEAPTCTSCCPGTFSPEQRCWSILTTRTVTTDSLDSDRGSDDESPTAEGDHPNNSTDTPETAVTPPHTDSCPPTPPRRITTSGASSGAPGTSSSSPAEEQPSATPAMNPSSSSDIDMEPETVGSPGSALKRPISETLGEEEGSGVKRPAFCGGGEPGVSPATAKTAPAPATAGDSGGAQSASENTTAAAEAIS